MCNKNIIIGNKILLLMNDSKILFFIASVLNSFHRACCSIFNYMNFFIRSRKFVFIIDWNSVKQVVGILYNNVKRQ